MRRFALIMPPGDGYRYHRDSLQFLTKDIVEAMLLDSFDGWTSDLCPHDENIVWITVSPETIMSEYGIIGHPSLIRQKLTSLVSKGLLIKHPTNPDAYALNVSEANNRIADWDKSRREI